MTSLAGPSRAQALHEVGRGLLGLVLPDGCSGCGAEDAPVLCTRCLPTLLAPASATRPSPPPPGLPPCWTVCAYEGHVRTVLAAYKEDGRRSLAAPLGAALGRSLLAALAHTSSPSRGRLRPGAGTVLVVPVPSSPESVRRRGRDAAAVLARVASAQARTAGYEVATTPVLALSRRVRDSAGLSAQQRAANLAGAHEVPDRLARLVAGREVLLVDDVLTTGASLAEATRALIAAGAEVRGAAVVAATPRRGATHSAVEATTVSSWHSPESVVASESPVSQLRLGRPAVPGKPMPVAGEAVHVRRLLVARSRCGLEVSPAPPGVQMSPDPGEEQ